MEITLEFEPGSEEKFPQHVSDIRDPLLDGGILEKGEKFPEQALPDERMQWYSSLLVQTALLFQRKAGHRVSFFSVASLAERQKCMALLEHEHCDVGMTAVKLAIEVLSGRRPLLKEPFRLFSKFARERLLPMDSEAVIKAARRRYIPAIHLERQPFRRDQFNHITGGECIRPNGLLMLGHGKHQQVLDGMYCLDRSKDLEGVLNSPDKRIALLKNLGINLASTDSKGMIGKKQYHLIVIGGDIICAVYQTVTGRYVVKGYHGDYDRLAMILSREIEFAPVRIVILSSDLSQPPMQSTGGVVDFDLAPDLDSYLGMEPLMLDQAAEALVGWLFPGKILPRMPIIAITGTNGKTTTTRMINHVLVIAGRQPGMVCTDGVYQNGEQVLKGDKGTRTGHLMVLTNKAVDIAVLESHHGGILQRGFAFRWCDIGICLNVTEDHLGESHIKTIEQMAELKGELPKRARHAAILNADDPHCVAMAATVTAEITCMVSMTLDPESLRKIIDKASVCFCVLEKLQGEEWVVIHERGHKHPVMATSRIPATFNRTARFNVSNAMHAIAACHLAGTDLDVIRKAMSGFKTGYESTPGRMNEFTDLPFRVIVDFAHNPDGLRRIAEFSDNQVVAGKKIIAFAGTANRPDETLKNMGRQLAGHFDFYFCKENVPKNNKIVREVAHLLQAGLLDRGVTRDQTQLKTHGKDVIFEIFDACEPDDLLIMLIGYVEMHLLPGYISEYKRFNV